MVNEARKRAKEARPARKECARHETIDVNIHGVRIRGELSPADEPTPASWGDLRLAAGAKCRSILFNAVGVFDDAMRAIRSVVRGIGAIGKLPEAVARRIAPAPEMRGDYTTDRTSAGYPRALAQLPEPRQPVALAPPERRVLVLSAPLIDTTLETEQNDPSGLRERVKDSTLSACTKAALARAGFVFVEDVRAASNAMLRSIDGIGRKTVRKIRAELARRHPPR